MPAQWTADIVGKMHIAGITAKELAAHLHYNPKYVSAVLNGKREPKNAEQIFRKGLDELIADKTGILPSDHRLENYYRTN